jgi:hypothetical protein
MGEQKEGPRKRGSFLVAKAPVANGSHADAFWPCAHPGLSKYLGLEVPRRGGI